jgi:hypothetical protein
MAVLLLLHLPPGVLLLSVTEVPTHIVLLPVMVAGRGFIVTVMLLLHPTAGQ